MRKFKALAALAVVLCAVAVSGYGICMAPAERAPKDQQQLEAELKENYEAMPAAAAASGKPSPTPTPAPAEEAAGETLPEAPADELQASGEQGAPADGEAEGAAEDPPQETCSPQTLQATMLGDSVMLGAYRELQEALPNCAINAAESRQVWDAKKIVQNMKDQGILSDTVVLALGTNGAFKQSIGQSLLDAIGPERQVYWINVYGKRLSWQEEANEAIEVLAENNPNLTVIDWGLDGRRTPRVVLQRRHPPQRRGERRLRAVCGELPVRLDRPAKPEKLGHKGKI